MYFKTGQVIFVPEWSKAEFVSFVVFILLTKSLLCNVDVINRDVVYSRIFKVFQKRYFKCSKKILYRFQLREVRSMFQSGRPCHASRRFEQFKVASVQTSMQYVQTLFRVREDSNFPLQTRSGKTACTRPDVRATTSGP
jgi:hypothetical protein